MDVFVRNNIVLLLFLVQIMTLVNGNRRKPSFCDEAQISSSFLWTLPNREPPVYFFGTIHVPYTRVWDYVPWSAKRAFERADSVFFELDLTDPETVAQLASCQMLPSGETLSDVLPGDIYRRLKRHLDYVKLMMPSWMRDEHRGLYAEYLFKAIAGNWEKKRPVWVMLMVNSLTESDVRSRGIPVLDLFLAREAARLGKRAGAVERVEEQCLPLNGLNVSQVLFALNQSLLLQESLRHGRSSPSYGTEDLVRHYNCGDLGSVGFGQDPSSASSKNGSSANELLFSRNMDMHTWKEDLSVFLDRANDKGKTRYCYVSWCHVIKIGWFPQIAELPCDQIRLKSSRNRRRPRTDRWPTISFFPGIMDMYSWKDDLSLSIFLDRANDTEDAILLRFLASSENGSSADELLLSRNMDKYFRKELIEKRNARMADRVLQLIRKYPDESFFFAFGAGHFLGNSSVLEYVEEGGFKVEQVAPDAKIRSYRRPHHHPRPRGPAEDGFTNDLSGTRGSWDDGSRRRYRKRGHHHHGVQLLRTVSTPPPTRGKQQRQFNDLWIKLDSKDRSSSRNTQASDDHFQRNSRKNSKLWYGGSSSGGVVLAIQMTIFHTFILTISVAIFSQRHFIVL